MPYCTNSMKYGEKIMSTTRKTITLTEQQDQWVKAQIEQGDYTNDSEYFRDLVRRDQAQKSPSTALKTSIMEGLESGVSERTLNDIWADEEARYKTKT